MKFTSGFQSDRTSLERGDKSDESKAQSNILLMQDTKFCASLKKLSLTQACAVTIDDNIVITGGTMLGLGKVS